MTSYLLAIDQGTSSTRAILFDMQGRPVTTAQQALTQYRPHSGWVEHDPEEIWQHTLKVVTDVFSKQAISGQDISAIGITNQRETTVLWDRSSGEVIAPAIVWQDRRTQQMCQGYIQQGLSDMVALKTGLLLDPYFSATKIRWLLDNIPNAKVKAEAGNLAFGTIDSFLLWRLTGGKQHKTDITNAARTLLFNIHTQTWDDELLRYFEIPSTLLPEVMDNCADFGITDKALLGAEIPIAAMAGDQQAALIGQCGFKKNMLKSTYGTGSFMILNTGDKTVTSKHRLLTTIAYRFNGTLHYALEGSIFVAGSALQWLRDQMYCFQSISESEALAANLSDAGGVVLVPAFTGLGAPYWDSEARGALFGLTGNTSVAQIVRAALEAVCYQTRDLIDVMRQDGAHQPDVLRVDGGMVVNDWLMQFLADILEITVERPRVIETTALGVAYLAGLHVGVFASLNAVNALWQQDRLFKPTMKAELREQYYAQWLACVQRVLTVS